MDSRNKAGEAVAVHCKDLSKFLSNVDTFYGKLVLTKLNDGASIPRDKKLISGEQILDALLVCLPKFLAAMYYLWYDVNRNFEKLGGGGWKEDWPGYEKDWVLYGSWGGELQEYLRSTDPVKYGGIIPGGFEHGEVRHNDHYGYRQGYNMVDDLRTLLDKDSTKHNLFRDVFATTVIPTTAGADIPNTANVLALMRTFCEIVDTERGGLNIEKHEELQTTLINWTNLVDHCQYIRFHLGKIFKGGSFSFTGYGRDLSEIKKGGFAKRTAAWFRGNMDKVKKNLAEIVHYPGDNYLNVFATNKQHHKIKYYHAELGKYFTKHFFPYGFTFSGENIYTLPNDPHTALNENWDSVIAAFNEQKCLEKFNTLLGGVEFTKEIVLENQDPASPPEISAFEGQDRVTPTEEDEPTTNETTVNEVTDLVTSNSDGTQNQDNDAEDTHNDITPPNQDVQREQNDLPVSQETSLSETSPGMDSSDPIHHEVQDPMDNFVPGSDTSLTVTPNDEDSGRSEGGASELGEENGQKSDNESTLDGETLHDGEESDVPGVDTATILNVEGYLVDDCNDIEGIYLDGTITPDDPDLMFHKKNEERTKWF
ncbi:Ribosome-binding protein 1, putative [Babesia ovata]|uniref:Ribosome-binding protein 1, putative n=1 Tax=Babesia ovata TaxID=189622 RepID=A0A2H6KFC7_9APIC|nr:Ribosome-binding protein 1, putative [Babesia ovata]GBE61703.1 Ribosome-binding protein 1, putative [Babesia ovata]